MSADPVEPVDPEHPLVPGDDPAGEPDERRYPSTIGGALYIACALAGGVGIVLVVVDDWRVGIRVFAAALGVAALARLTLPARDAGMLAVRSRWIDVALLAAVGATLWWLAGSIPDQPGT